MVVRVLSFIVVCQQLASCAGCFTQSQYTHELTPAERYERTGVYEQFPYEACTNISLHPFGEVADGMPAVSVTVGETFTFDCHSPFNFVPPCQATSHQTMYWKLNGLTVSNKHGCRLDNVDKSLNLYQFIVDRYKEFYYQLQGTAQKTSHQGSVECAFRWGGLESEIYILQSYLTVVSEDLNVPVARGEPVELLSTDDDRLIDAKWNNLPNVEYVRWYYSKNKPATLQSPEYDLVFSYHPPHEAATYSRWTTRLGDILFSPETPLMIKVKWSRAEDDGIYKCETQTKLLGRPSYGVRKVTVGEKKVAGAGCGTW